MKSQRQFWMQVQGASRTWTITSPITLEVGVERGIWQGLSDGTFVLHNLAPSTRSDIYLDWNNQGEFRAITVRAGYASWQSAGGAQSPQAYPIIFQGNVKQAFSVRSGPDWVTTISAWDGGFGVTQGDLSVPLAPGTTFQQQAQALIAAMPNVSLGYIDPSLTVDAIRGVSLVGSPWEKLQQMADSAYADLFIDLQKVYMVSKGQPIPDLTGGLGIITSATGLLDTPVRQKSIVSFSMIFEPRVKVGQALVLQSLETVNNGSYTVGGISHSGIISDAVSGDLRTKISCYYPQAYAI